MGIIGDYEPHSREGLVIAALREAWDGDPSGVMRINSREHTAGGGLALSDVIVSRMEVRHAFDVAARRGLITERQCVVLLCRYGTQPHSPMQTAQVLRTNLNAVLVDTHHAIQALVRVLWDEPEYVSPPRLRRPVEEIPPAVVAGMTRLLARVVSRG